MTPPPATPASEAEHPNHGAQQGFGVMLAAVIACKLVAIFTLWLLYFHPGKRPEQTPSHAATSLLGTPASSHAQTTSSPLP